MNDWNPMWYEREWTSHGPIGPWDWYAEISEPVRLVSRGTLVRIRSGSPFSSEIVDCGHCLVTLSLTVNETLKWLSSLHILMQE